MGARYFIGIDPGLAATGWAVLESVDAAGLIVRGAGTVRSGPGLERDFPGRAARMAKETRSQIRQALPVLEGHVRGAIELSDRAASRKNSQAVFAQAAVAGAIIGEVIEIFPDLVRVTPQQWMQAREISQCHETARLVLRPYPVGELSDHARDAVCIALALSAGRIDALLRVREAREAVRREAMGRHVRARNAAKKSLQK